MASIYRRGRVWWLMYRDPLSGRLVRRSLKTISRQRALYELSDVQRRSLTGQSIPDGSALWSEAWNRYLEHSQATKTVGTHRGDATKLQRFVREVHPVHLADVTPAVVEGYRDRLIAAGKAPATANLFVNVMSGFMRWAIGQGLIAANPCQGVRRLRIPERRPRFLDRTQLDAVLEAARLGDRETYLRIAIAALAGLRASEISALAWEDLDLQGNVIHVIGKPEHATKSGRNRTVPLCSELRRILEPHRGKGWLFAPPVAGRKPRYEGLRAVEKAAGVGRLGWHLFRHTYASILVQAGVSVYKVGRWLGHGSPAMTQRYAHLAPEHDEDAELISRPPGRG